MVKSPLSKISGFSRDHPKFLFGQVFLMEIYAATVIFFHHVAPLKV
jgi:hypothetical protein